MLTVVLEGGLGNRMRVAAAAAEMAQHLDTPVRCLWMEQWGMRCRMDVMFDQSPLTAVGSQPFTLRDATAWETFSLARPQRRNLHLPRLVQRLFFSGVIFSEEVMPMRMRGFDFLNWARGGGDRVIHAYRDFYQWDTTLLSRLFVPSKSIVNLIDDRCATFSSHTIGVHIRRTDNQESINESPLELFEEKIDMCIALHQDTQVYLATDDEPTKAHMCQRYGSRIVTSRACADRESTEGIVEALVEMYALSRTAQIYGSAGSTYSEMAAALGNCPFEVVHRESARQPERGLWTK